MFSKRLVTTACASAILMTMSATQAPAQTPTDQRTEFTFNQPIELPGATLPPGTYIFRLADSMSHRNIMQVTAKDSTSKPIGFFLTVNTQRPQPSEKAELRFLETPAGQPAAVKTWWYPGEKTGRQFIYPKSQARRLAQATNQTVLTTQAESVTADQMKTADLSYVSASGEETALTDDQLVDAAANTAPVGTSARAPVQESTSAANTTRTSLPKTSTPLAGIALMGLMSLLGAASIRKR